MVLISLLCSPFLQIGKTRFHINEASGDSYNHTSKKLYCPFKKLNRLKIIIRETYTKNGTLTSSLVP